MRLRLRAPRSRGAVLLGLALAALALALGANTAVLAVLDALWFRPLPWAGSDRLVTAEPRQTLSALQLADVAARVRGLGPVAFHGGAAMDLTGDGAPERLGVTTVSGGWFGLLGATARLGRVLGPDDDVPGAPRTVVLSDGLWRRRFGADPAAVGATVTLAGEPFTVVGVMPPGFHGPLEDGEAWLPVQTGAASVAAARGAQTFLPFGRLVPGATPAAAQAELDAVLAGLRTEHPREDHGIAWRLVPLRTRLAAPASRAATLLQLAGALAVLVAALNFGHVLLARQLARRHELGVRLALGATPGRLARDLARSALALAAVSGIAGALVAWLLLPGFVALVGDGAPGAGPDVRLSGTVLAGTGAVTLVAGVLSAWAPGVKLARMDLAALVRGRVGLDGGGPLRAVVLGVQLVVATALGSAAVALVVAWLRLLGASPGFEPSGVLAARFSLPEARYGDLASQQRFREELLARVRALPGASEAGIVSELPLGGQQMAHALLRRDRPVPAGEEPSVAGRVVDAGYFRAMRIALVEGRTLSDDDRAGRPRVALVNRAFVRRFGDGRTVLGRDVAWNGEEPAWMRIVGIVDDVRESALDAPVEPTVFVPWAQNDESWHRWGWLVVRGRSGLAAGIRAAFAAGDPLLPAPAVRPVSALIDASLASRRSVSTLLVAFAVLTALMSLVALGGTWAQEVERRRPELGVRRALGATTGGVLRLVVGRALRLVLPCATLGLGAAELCFRAGLLPAPVGDRWGTTLGVAGGAVAIAVLAVAWPAWRATRADPLEALRDAG